MKFQVGMLMARKNWNSGTSPITKTRGIIFGQYSMKRISNRMENPFRFPGTSRNYFSPGKETQGNDLNDFSQNAHVRWNFLVPSLSPARVPRTVCGPGCELFRSFLRRAASFVRIREFASSGVRARKTLWISRLRYCEIVEIVNSSTNSPSFIFSFHIFSTLRWIFHFRNEYHFRFVFFCSLMFVTEVWAKNCSQRLKNTSQTTGSANWAKNSFNKSRKYGRTIKGTVKEK